MYNVNSTCQIQGLANIYQGVFGNKTNGYFVDVGAFDGYSYSNTDALILAGWSGILLEPTTKFFAQCYERWSSYSGLIIAKFAVGDYNGVATIYTGEHAISTIDTNFKTIVESTDWGKNLYKDKEVCKVRTLDSILEGYHINESQIDVLSIDVEGYELHVLKGFDIARWNPKMVIIEAHEMYAENDRPVLHPQINEYFYANNYVRIYCDEINNIYLKLHEDYNEVYNIS